MQYILIVAVTLVCALQAITSTRLLISAIWLAITSAMVALLLYLLGAPEVAVIELSVGAGLVTVLFVFAINITGDEELSMKTMIPGPVAWGIVLLTTLLLGLINFSQVNQFLPVVQEQSFQVVLWEERTPDIFLQVLLIFTGVLGILGLLAEKKISGHKEGVV
jgi:uncharacterized MnhB-related membrane protein